jgi:hypothetical protein
MIRKPRWSATPLQGWSRKQVRRNRWRQLWQAPNILSDSTASFHVTRCTSHSTAEFSCPDGAPDLLADHPERLMQSNPRRRVVFSTTGCQKDDDFRMIPISDFADGNALKKIERPPVMLHRQTSRRVALSKDAWQPRAEIFRWTNESATKQSPQKEKAAEKPYGLDCP